MQPLLDVRPSLPGHPEAAPRPAAPGFSDTLHGLLKTAGGVEAQAAAHVDRFAVAAPGELHETAIAVSKAEIAFRLLMSVRNRLLESYREVMRMGM
jgi:flagellar hook-basal body complex protein FliE